MDRKRRKLEHLQCFADLTVKLSGSGFEDVSFINYPLSDISLSKVDLSVDFLGKKMKAPIIINAITGGHPDTIEINKALAAAARETGVAMAVGSQKAALEDVRVKNTFSIAREENPDGILLANLSATSKYEEAIEAVEMIGADGLQVHLNIPQELFMTEGDCDFYNVLPNIMELTQKVPVPVIAKEVGFGMSKESVFRLYDAGIKIIDIAGKGGTNFIAIENARSGNQFAEFEDWGIPTAISLIEGIELNLPVNFIASGGINNSLDIAKALASGAKMVAIAGPLLRELNNNSLEGLINYINKLKIGLAKVMVMTGAGSLSELCGVPLVITGKTAEWLIRRGIDINAYARRSL